MANSSPLTLSVLVLLAHHQAKKMLRSSSFSNIKQMSKDFEPAREEAKRNSKDYEQHKENQEGQLLAPLPGTEASNEDGP